MERIKIKYKLPSERSVNSVSEDLFSSISLEQTSNQLLEGNVIRDLDSAQVYIDERASSNTFRYYGSIEYISQLANIPLNYTTKEDIFLNQRNNPNVKTVITDFDFYLLKPSTAYTELNSFSGITGNVFQQKLEVIGTPFDFNIKNAGFQKNIFNTQNYYFNLNIDYDINEQYDGLGLPVNTLYLLAFYKTSVNGNSQPEILESVDYNVDGNESKTDISGNQLTYGDIVDGDIIQYDTTNFSTNVLKEKEYILSIPIDDNGNTEHIKYSYKPFFNKTLKPFSDELNQISLSGSSYEDQISIPSYAIDINNDGEFRWRNLLDVGYIDPISDIGVDFPFNNQKHYVFDNIKIDFNIDTTDSFTNNLYNEVILDNSTIIDNTPNSSPQSLDDIC